MMQGKKPIGAMIARLRPAFLAVALFSGVVNLLALTGSFYMLQVYDRVLASRSISTLIALSVLCFGLYVLNAVLEAVRTKVLNRLGARLERDLLTPVHDLLLKLPLAGRSPADSTQPLRDMEALRLALSGAVPVAFVDLPWMPFFLAFIFMLHPLLGVVALAGMVALVAITIMTDRRMREPTREQTIATARRMAIAETARRNAEVIRAMGFGARAAERFHRISKDVFSASEKASDISNNLGGISRTLRLVLQSAMIGVGAWLVLQGQMSGGSIVAASIVLGRAIAPVEMAIANWKIFTTAKQARARLDDLIAVATDGEPPMTLPEPKTSLAVEGLAVAAPGQRTPLVRNVTFQLKAGDALAILGPSGAGKSSLVRGLVGAWHSMLGKVRLDGAPLEQYPDQMIGAIIGYLPQDVDLFDGSIAENIARLDEDAPEEKIIAAAKAAGVHDLILRLPQGYNTVLGEGGSTLSVGQRQRVGLARALYGDPFLIVLDEPNAHLDQEGEEALARAVAAMRAKGRIVLIVAHRPAILAQCNMVAYVLDGELRGIGPRDEMLRKIEDAARQRAGAAQASAQPAAAARTGVMQPPSAPPSSSTPLPIAPKPASAATPASPPVLQTSARITGRMVGPKPAKEGSGST